MSAPESTRKSLRCLFGMHNWYWHTVHGPRFERKDGNTMDKICLECGHEDREASRLHAKAKAKKNKVATAERLLKIRKDKESQ